MVRRTLDRTGPSTLDLPALDRVGTFLFRRVMDRDRSVLALGVHAEVSAPDQARDWVFGHVAYDLGDGSGHLRSRHQRDPALPLERWFVPRTVIEWSGGRTLVHLHPAHEEEGSALASVLLQEPRAARNDGRPLGPWVPDTDRGRYLANARRLLRHIQRGDIYEVNYCTRHSARAVDWDPYAAFGRMLQRSRAPFAAFYREGERFVLCASPERFLAIDGDRVVGEPMKGTRPRSSDPEEDGRLAAELASDAKERAENVMAVDVMRHDLARVAASRSVTVPELCAVRSYPAVHQMVSTVAATLAPGSSAYAALLAAFPMASMTGAPKIRAMELIDEAEDRARGLFSGTFGFFAPDGTADLNVVIRSVFFDRERGTAAIHAGSALTANCDPETEWEECALKARSVMEAIA